MGMDSLTAMEFRGRLEQSLGIPLSSTLALDYSTVETLAPFLLDKIPGLQDSSNGTQHAKEETLSPSALMLQDLSEEEVEELLIRKLESLGSAATG